MEWILPGRPAERRRRAARKGCCTKSANGFARGAPPPLLLPQRGVRRVLRGEWAAAVAAAGRSVGQERESDAIAGRQPPAHSFSRYSNEWPHANNPTRSRLRRPPQPPPRSRKSSVCGLGGRRSSFATTSPRVARPSVFIYTYAVVSLAAGVSLRFYCFWRLKYFNGLGWDLLRLICIQN